MVICTRRSIGTLLPTLAVALKAGAWLALPPADVAAQLTLTMTSDSVVDANALLMASSGTWGRAINGVSFQADALITFNGYQYTTWYRNDSDLSVMIARRTVDGQNAGAWEVVDTGTNFLRGKDTWNAHNVISMGISQQDGRIHLSYDHHAQSLKYRVSSAGVATTNPDAWGPSMFGAERNFLVSGAPISVLTYPSFHNTPSGGLNFSYRNNSSGNGDMLLSTYDNGTWTASSLFIGRTGTYTEGTFTSTSRNAYINGLDYGPDGKLHVTWTWREDPAGSNHDISYAYSEDGGVTWKNNAGAVVANTGLGDAITIGDPGLVVQTLPRNQALRNQQAQAVDNSGRVHVLMAHRRQEPGYEWQSGDPIWSPLDAAYFHYVRDPISGQWTQHRLPVATDIFGDTEEVLAGTRPKIAFDADGNVLAVYTNRQQGNTYPYSAGDLVIAGATAAADYGDWTILHIEKLPSGFGFISEPMIDQQRLLDHGILSIFAQEDNPSISGATGTKLHVFEFAVHVSNIPEPASAAAAAFGAGLLMTKRPGRRLRQFSVSHHPQARLPEGGL